MSSLYFQGSACSLFSGVYCFLKTLPALLGMALVYTGKLWFLDRMVWLWEDMKDNPAYARLTVSAGTNHRCQEYPHGS